MELITTTFGVEGLNFRMKKLALQQILQTGGGGKGVKNGTTNNGHRCVNKKKKITTSRRGRERQQKKKQSLVKLDIHSRGGLLLVGSG